MNDQMLERFVDADEAGKFLSLNRRRILELARSGKLPGHPVGDGTRRVWRFRLSELANAVSSTTKPWFSSRQRTSMVRPKSDAGAIRTEG
jgi:Helix-turn-helix domain